MKYYYKRCGAVLLMLVALQVQARDIKTQDDLSRAFEDAVQCKSDVDARDAKVRSELRRLGVKVSGADEDLINLDYRLPPGVRIFDQNVSEVIYEGDSGSMFLARIPANEATMKQIRDRLRLQPIPASGQRDWGIFDKVVTQYYRPVQTPTEEDPYPDLIIAGTERRGGRSYVLLGCRKFDY
jgi:hypothetical protein